MRASEDLRYATADRRSGTKICISNNRFSRIDNRLLMLNFEDRLLLVRIFLPDRRSATANFRSGPTKKGGLSPALFRDYCGLIAAACVGRVPGVSVDRRADEVRQAGEQAVPAKVVHVLTV